MTILTCWSYSRYYNRRNDLQKCLSILDLNFLYFPFQAALWFSGKTAVASIQRSRYEQHRYFGASLTACKSYASKDLREDELYMTWITIGLNQVLKQDDIRFVIVDFPRPGKVGVAEIRNLVLTLKKTLNLTL